MTSEAIELNAAADVHLGFDAKGLLADMYLSQDSLRTLAEETGGYAAVNSNNITTALNRIVRLNSTYYVLGYYPKDARRDGRFHKIEVRTKRPGLRVSARKGYVSPRSISAEERARQERERERGRGRAGSTQTSNRTARDFESTASAEWFDDDRARSAVQRRGKRRVCGAGDRSGRRPSPLRRAAQQDVCRRRRAERVCARRAGPPARRQFLPVQS